MIAPDLDSALARLNDFVHEAQSIVPFTGAGISTECGIPDFRSPGAEIGGGESGEDDGR